MMRRWRSPESLLLPIGEALAKFVCEEDFTNVKGLRGTWLHADVRRSYPEARKTMVQHGDLRQTAPKQAAHRRPAQEEALMD